MATTTTERFAVKLNPDKTSSKPWLVWDNKNDKVFAYMSNETAARICVNKYNAAFGDL